MAKDTLNIDYIYYGNSVVAVSGWIGLKRSPRFELDVFIDGEKVEAESILYHRPDVSDHLGDSVVAAHGFMVLLNVPLESKQSLLPRLTCVLNGKVFKAQALNPQVVDSVEFLFQQAEGLNHEKIDCLRRALDKDISLTISDDQAVPLTSINAQVRCKIDVALRLAPDCVYIEGWLDDPGGVVQRIELQDQKERYILEEHNIFWFRRQDVSGHLKLQEYQKGKNLGFFAAVAVRSLAPQASVKFFGQDGSYLESEVIIDQGIADRTLFTRQLLIWLGNPCLPSASEGARLVRNILEALWGQVHKANSVSCMSFGHSANQPRVSVVVPIYGRCDYVLHQLAHFSRDPFFKQNAELVYVLDDPGLEDEFVSICAGAYQVYGLPFKALLSQYNLGYAGANNAGVEACASDRVLLLNSDVLPRRKGWLQRLLYGFEQLENIGILGARLLYEDDTLQHIGMSWEKSIHYPSLWLNTHPNKGLHAEHVSLPEWLCVPAVTGACMLLEKSFYKELGGLDWRYFLGDCEDSDLSLKCAKAGREVYVDTRSELYHLERQSQTMLPQASSWRYFLSLLNLQRQSYLWGDHIAARLGSDHG